MDITVAIVGLPEELARRTRIALNLQAGFGFRVRHTGRIDAGLDLLVLETDAAEGAAALNAAAPGTALLCFGQSLRLPATAMVAARDRTIVDLKSDIRILLEELRRGRDSLDNRGAGAGPAAIVRLADDPALDRPNLRLTNGDVSLLIRRGASRVLAKGHSDIVTGADRLGLGDWRIEALERFDPASVSGWTSRSLDSFLVRGARARGVNLPRFPGAPMRLEDWPDLGESNDPLAMRISGLLLKGAATVDTLADATGADPAAISNLLWAFKAARLLTGIQVARPVRSMPTAAPIAAHAGFLARLARRFGMGGVTG